MTGFDHPSTISDSWVGCALLPHIFEGGVVSVLGMTSMEPTGPMRLLTVNTGRPKAVPCTDAPAG